ncbi:hypothetical protein [Micromonospora sp. DT233]|uniref:hypothetical protein n=1 Tax=Micromonospora sp. DT233 TaxID=3393432 RepID=UPI003CEAF8B4
MGGDLTDRLRGGALATLTVLVVAAGVAWWRAEAPTTSPPGGPSGASAVLSRVPSDGSTTTSPGRSGGPGVASGGPTAGSPWAGRRLRASPGPVAWMVAEVDPRTGRVIARPGVGARAPRVGIPSGRPVEPSRTLWRDDRLTLRPGLPPQRRVVTPAGARPHLLEYRCAGRGQVLLVSVHWGRTESRRAPCDGTAAVLFLSGRDGPIRIEFSAPGGGPAIVATHLTTVPF